MIDKDYPIFILAGSIMEEEVHNSILTPELNKFKLDLFDTSKIILHYADYSRSKNKFERMRNTNFRQRFYSGLTKVISDTPFILIASIISKVEHRKKYIYASDPYILSLEVILERFVLELKKTKENGIVIAESRSQQLDNELELAFLNLKISGTRFFTPKEITDSIKDFTIRKKEENIAGLQLTDSVVSQIGRKYLGYKNYFDYEVIKSKFSKHQCGKYLGYGLVILPRK